MWQAIRARRPCRVRAFGCRVVVAVLALSFLPPFAPPPVVVPPLVVVVPPLEVVVEPLVVLVEPLVVVVEPLVVPVEPLVVPVVVEPLPLLPLVLVAAASVDQSLPTGAVLPAMSIRHGLVVASWKFPALRST